MGNSWYERNREKVLKKLNKRYEEDKEFREKTRKRYREKYHNDPEYRKKTIERAKKRYRKLKKKKARNKKDEESN